jgi:alpha-glucosidase
MRAVVEGVEAGLPHASWPVYTGSNHDAGRLATRWAGGDEARTRTAVLMVLALRGTPFLYYGDEIGLPDVDIPPERRLDPAPDGRDRCRTPMQWSAEPGAGFTDGGHTWLPLGDAAACNVADQRADRASILHLVRDLIALRRERTDLHGGGYATLPAPAGAWAWRRGEGTAVAVNLSGEPAAVDGIEGAVLIGTDRARDGERVRGTLTLAPWSGTIVGLDA